MKPEQWIIEGEVGTSSKTIWAVMMGVVNEKRQCDDWHYDTPKDPSDFGRCWKLINLFPEWESRLHEVSDVFPKWIPFVSEWDRLTTMYEDALREGKEYAPGMYGFMQELNDEAMLLDGWIQDSPSSWHRPNKGTVNAQ
jgi:hypothetical protein